MASRRLGTLVLLAILTPAGRTSAQQDQGTVAGRVTDSTGAVLAGAVVAATAASGGSVYTRTNAEGHYVLGPLVIGRYQITIEMPGFRRAVSEPIDVHANARVRFDARLELGPLTDTIAVRPAATLLKTDTSSLTYVIGADQIGQLPVNGRNFQQLAMLAPGVFPAFGHLDREAGFNSHGQWASQNNFILDGVDNNSHIVGLQDRKAQVLVPNIDAVQEFQVHTSNYNAEFGGGAGAVMSVSIKSGTNVLRGTAHEFLRNDVFDARDTFAYHDRSGDGKADPDRLRRHQYGFTVGGPIQKGRTFYFGSVEATSIHTTENSLVTVPTRLERRGIFDPNVVMLRDPLTGLVFPGNAIPRDRWDPVAAQLLSLWPEPNFAGTTRANYASSPAHVRDRLQYDLRVDHTFSPRDRMFVRASRMGFRGDRQGALPPPGVGTSTNEIARDDNAGINLALSETHVLGPAAVHEARLGFNSLRTTKRPVVQGFPNHDFGLHVAASEPVEGLARVALIGPLGFVPLGEAMNNPNDKTARTLQLLENLAIAKGRHSIKVGMDLRWIRSNIVGGQQARGMFNFNGRFTGSSLGDFLLGMTSSRAVSTVQRANLRERHYMFYVQDDWRVAPRLILNLGVRYDLIGPPFDADNRLTSLDASVFPEVRVLRAGERGSSWSDRALVNTDTNNWAPRIGLAYVPASLWTIRAAGGIFYGMPKGLGANVRLINNWPQFREVIVPSTPTRSAGQLADGIDESLVGTATTMPANLSWYVWSREFPLPTIYQWNFSVQRQLRRSWVVTTAYVGSSSRHLHRLYDVNAADPGDSTTERERRMVPAIAQIAYIEPSGSGNYHAFEAAVERRLANGVQGALAYTWSHSIDDVTEAGSVEGPIVQDKRNLRGDRGNSWFDRRHRLVASALVELPFGSDRRWLRSAGALGVIFGGWQVSGIVSMQSGAHFDVAVLDPTNRLGVTPGSSVWRPDLIGDPRMPHPTADGWINQAAFAVPQNPDGTYRYGNLGRNPLLGPGYFSLDAALMREVRLGSTRRVQLRWEVFNASNHPSYGLPNASLGSPDFGTIRTTVSAPRQMQFGLKFLF
jgi:Carboxypeptidase regulatory-like domain/TonB dependent receptor-like, beta-barrel/TonB-dependent Receptor Plug Domain